MTSLRGRQERGSSLLGTAFGVAVLLSLTGFAADVGLGLWARSVVDAAASDAAREIAALPPGSDGPDRAAAAVERARSTLGPFGARVRMQVGTSDQAVTVRVVAPPLGLLPRVAGGGSVVGGLDRTVVVRREAW
jgi:Flp pilus assembly protein TadG